MSRPLAGKTALVTGASRGIGAAIARRLAADGAHVIVHYGASRDGAEQVVADIRAAGGTADAVQADLDQPNAAAQLATAVGAPTIDILVNNAGIAPFAGIAQTDEATFDSIVNVNMRSLFFVTQRFLARIPDGGRIINLSTRVTKTTFPGIPVYSASKGFVDVLTLHMAAELGARSITVNAVAPGAVDTQMSAWVRAPGGAETIAQVQALPGIAQPERIANVVSFLAGPDGAWTTGHVLDASGGTKL
ncbi:MAG: SDR family oxidoreductase [Gemmatimonadaceae bacterium]|jgi:NAD(P)-dependent dehydrogenase (short-subunit alcohol dehydrogenase family)|nr:SDR family oxidoreductase [Gemmatimonadaceae bacterium]